MRQNKFTAFGRGRQKQAGQMNKNEAKYQTHLERLKQSGQVLWYEYEPMTLKLADGARYNPDFVVMMASGMIECHEVKGGTKKETKSGDKVSRPFVHDSASLVKIKVAAEKFPFVFRIVWPDREVWHSEEY